MNDKSAKAAGKFEELNDEELSTVSGGMSPNVPYDDSTWGRQIPGYPGPTWNEYHPNFWETDPNMSSNQGDSFNTGGGDNYAFSGGGDWGGGGGDWGGGGSDWG